MFDVSDVVWMSLDSVFDDVDDFFHHKRPAKQVRSTGVRSSCCPSGHGTIPAGNLGIW